MLKLARPQRHIIYNLARYAANITISGMKACIIRVRGFFQVEMTDKGLGLGLWGLEFSSNEAVSSHMMTIGMMWAALLGALEI